MGEPEVRVSDAERNAVVEVLRAHCADGRLSLDEFAERVEVALSSRIQGDLDEVLADLPTVSPAGSDAASGPRRPAIGTTLAIMCGAKRRGRWRLEGSHTAIALMGGACLDLRHAEIVGSEITITAIAIMGGVDIIVPDGIEVQLDGLAIMGGKESKLRGHRVLPGSPIVRVKAFAFWGGVVVRTKDKSAEKIDQVREHIDLVRELGVPLPPKIPQPHGRNRDQNEWNRERNREQNERNRQRHREQNGGSRSRQRLPEGTVTVLVTDLEGSTEMAEALGDLRFHDVLARHDRLVRACVEQHDGFVVKGTGDGFLLAFSSARQALLCASELQHAFDDDEQLAIRMGVHSGEVVRADGDLYGKTVIVASRLASAAAGGEVLVSAITKALTESGGDLRFATTREIALKGLAGTQEAWTLDWSA